MHAGYAIVAPHGGDIYGVLVITGAVRSQGFLRSLGKIATLRNSISARELGQSERNLRIFQDPAGVTTLSEVMGLPGEGSRQSFRASPNDRPAKGFGEERYMTSC